MATTNWNRQYRRVLLLFILIITAGPVEAMWPLPWLDKRVTVRVFVPHSYRGGVPQHLTWDDHAPVEVNNGGCFELKVTLPMSVKLSTPQRSRAAIAVDAVSGNANYQDACSGPFPQPFCIQAGLFVNEARKPREDQDWSLACPDGFIKLD